MNWTDIIIALVSAISGGGLLKFLDFMLARNKNKIDANKQWRDELRADLDRTNKKIEELERKLEQKELENDKLQASYMKLEYKYKMFRLKVYQSLLDHGISKQVVEEILEDYDNESDEDDKSKLV